MKIFLAGVRGSTPAPGEAFVRYGGNTPCVAVTGDDGSTRLVLDAGTGIRRVPEILGSGPFQGTILFTHLHWDHVQGLPFFRSLDREEGRGTLVLPQHPQPLEVFKRVMSPPFFPIDPTEMRCEIDFVSIDEGRFEAEGFDVLARKVPHKGGPTFGYRVSDGKGSVTYVSDHNPTALGDGPEGLGEYHPAVMELAEGVDVLLHDAQYLAEDFAAHASFGHSAAEYAVGLAEKAACKKLLLFHHDPDRTDDQLDEIERSFKDAGIPVEVAVEGRTIDVLS
jgi:phosphoribosyl 1,2-cyclic phosphodiesterase